MKTFLRIKIKIPVRVYLDYENFIYCTLIVEKLRINFEALIYHSTNWKSVWDEQDYFLSTYL